MGHMSNWNRFVRETLAKQRDKSDKGREKITSANKLTSKKRTYREKGANESE